jgi:hypothetical protein
MRHGWLTVGWTQPRFHGKHTHTGIANRLGAEQSPSSFAPGGGAGRKTRIGFKHVPELDAGKPDAPLWTLRHHLCGARIGIEQ